MPALSPAAIYRLATDAGLTPAQAVVATAIALAESGGRTDAVGDTSLMNATWGPSVGLWQIRSLKADRGTGRARDETRLADPAFNARAMVEISGGGANWRPWSVYTSGTYRTQLDRVHSTTPGGHVENGATTGPLDRWQNGVETIAEAVNPFDGWSSDLLGVGVKLAAGATALALVIVGLNRAVSG